MLSQLVESSATDTEHEGSIPLHALIGYNIILIGIRSRMVLRFDCKSKSWGSIPPCLSYLVSSKVEEESLT